MADTEFTNDDLDRILGDIAAAPDDKPNLRDFINNTDESTLAPKYCPACKGSGFVTIYTHSTDVGDGPCNVCGGDLPNVPKEIEEWVRFNDHS